MEDDTTDMCDAFFEYDFGITPWGIFTTNLSDDGGAPSVYYSWEFGDGGTSSEFEPVHNYAMGGSYNVCLTVTTPTCSDTYCTIVDIASTIEDMFISELLITPNPARDLVQIQFYSASAESADLIVTDITGKQILSIPGQAIQAGINRIQLDTHTWNSGLYMFNIQTQNANAVSEKILVVH